MQGRSLRPSVGGRWNARTFAISWYLTGSSSWRFDAGLEFVTKIGWYYFHERVWSGGRLGPALITVVAGSNPTCP